MQANFHTDCRGMQAQLVALSSLMAILDPQLTSHLVGFSALHHFPFPSVQAFQRPLRRVHDFPALPM